MTIKIAKKIVDYSVVSAEDEIPVPDEPAAEEIDFDFDPTLESRETPDGFIEMLRYKQEFVDPKGKANSLYVMVGYEVRKAMKAGEEFWIEHPVEVFAPAKEQTGDATAMILSSRCLRSGTPPSEVINDFCSVALPETWFVRLPNGKQTIVNSMSAVIGEAIKQNLIQRGILDEMGNDVPYYLRPRLTEANGREDPRQEQAAEIFELNQSVGAAKTRPGGKFQAMGMDCPECGEDEWVIKDGCPTCSCGHSKCG